MSTWTWACDIRRNVKSLSQTSTVLLPGRTARYVEEALDCSVLLRREGLLGMDLDRYLLIHLELSLRHRHFVNARQALGHVLAHVPLHEALEGARNGSTEISRVSHNSTYTFWKSQNTVLERRAGESVDILR
jgi:hypothetical protein